LRVVLQQIARFRAAAILALLAIAAPVWVIAAEAPRAASSDKPAAGQPSADQVSAAEYLLKAAFIYNFAKFTVFPPEAFANSEGVMRNCVIGADDQGAAFDTIEGKIVEGRRVTTRFLPDASRLQGCHIVFLSKTRQAMLGAVVGAAAERGHMLTVSDMPDFARKGGMIGLKSADDRVRFEINTEAAERARLQFSSRLLRLADLISDGPNVGKSK
jgi:YfiR/HmsC-like